MALAVSLGIGTWVQDDGSKMMGMGMGMGMVMARAK